MAFSAPSVAIAESHWLSASPSSKLREKKRFLLTGGEFYWGSVLDTEGWLVLFSFCRRVRIGGALILSAATASGGFLRSFRRYRREPLALCFTLQQATGEEAFFIKRGCSIGGLDFGYGMAGWFCIVLFLPPCSNLRGAYPKRSQRVGWLSPLLSSLSQRATGSLLHPPASYWGRSVF